MTFWHIGHVWEHFLTKFCLHYKIGDFQDFCHSFYVVLILPSPPYLNFKWIFISIYQKNKENNPNILAFWPYLKKKFNEIVFCTKSLVILRLWAFILHCSNFSVPISEAVDTSILYGFFKSIYKIRGRTMLGLIGGWPLKRIFKLCS